MATNVGELNVKLTADARSLESALGSAQSAISGFTVAATTAFVAVGGAIGIATAAAQKQEEAEIRLKGALKATGQSTDISGLKAYASALQEVTTFGDEVTLESAAMLASFAMTEDQIKGLIPAVQNLAAFTGRDLKEAAIGVGKVVAIGAGAFTDWGIALSEAEKKAFNAGDQATRVAMAMDILHRNTGDAAKALANTAGGAMEQFKGAAGDVLEAVGRLVRTPVMDFFGELKLAAKGAGAVVEHFGEMFKRITPEAKASAVELGKVALKATGVGLAFLAVNKVLPVFKVLAAASSVASAGLGASLKGLLKSTTSLAGGLFRLALPFAAVAAGLVGTVVLVGAVSKAWDAGLFGMKDQVKGLASSIREAIPEALDWVQKQIGGFASNAVEALAVVMGMLKGETPEQIFKRVKAFEAAIGPTLEDAANDFKEGLASIVEAGEEGQRLITDAVKNSGIGEVLGDLRTAVRQTVRAFTRGARPGKGPTAAAKGGGAAAVGDIDFAPVLASLRNKAAEKSEQLSTAFGDAANTVSSGLGESSEILSAAMQGAQAGPIGIAIAAIVALLMKTETFGEIIAALNTSIGSAVRTIDALLVGIGPLFTSLISLSNVVTGIATAFFSMTSMLVPFGAVVEGFTSRITEVTTLLTKGFNNIVVAIARFVKKIPGIGKSLHKQVMKLAIMTGEEVTPDVSTLNDSADKASDQLSETGEKLLNVPAGFKVVAARYNAQNAQLAAGGPDVPGTGGAGGAGGAGGGLSAEARGGVNIGQVNISGVNDPEKIYSEFKQAMKRDIFANSGSSFAGRGAGAAVSVA